MRSGDEPGRTEQRAFVRGFGLEHVERGAGDMPGVEPRLKRRLIDQPAACAVDDAHALLGLGQILGRQDVARLVGQRRVQRDEIGAREQVVELHLLHAHLHCAFGRQERIERHHLHFQPSGAIGDDRADVPRTDQPQSLGGELDAHEAVLFPLAGLRRGVRLRQLAGEREHQRDRVFGGGDRVAERRIHHHHAFGRGGGDVDVVDADPGATNHLQLGGVVEDVLGDLGRAADRQPVIAADDRLQLVRRLAGDLVDLDTALAENLRGAGVHLVGNEHLGHVRSPRWPGDGRDRAPSSAHVEKRPRACGQGDVVCVYLAALACTQAQSSHGPSASISAVSTVAPHQMRSPAGASR